MKEAFLIVFIVSSLLVAPWFALGWLYGWLCGKLIKDRKELLAHSKFQLHFWRIAGPIVMSAFGLLLVFVVQAPAINSAAFTIAGMFGIAAAVTGIQLSIKRGLEKRSYNRV